MNRDDLKLYGLIGLSVVAGVTLVGGFVGIGAYAVIDEEVKHSLINSAEKNICEDLELNSFEFSKLATAKNETNDKFFVVTGRSTKSYDSAEVNSSVAYKINEETYKTFNECFNSIYVYFGNTNGVFHTDDKHSCELSGFLKRGTVLEMFQMLEKVTKDNEPAKFNTDIFSNSEIFDLTF